jgi:hypothetical protein
MPRREGSRVSGTGPEERGRLSDPHQIAVRDSAENEQRAEHYQEHSRLSINSAR